MKVSEKGLRKEFPKNTTVQATAEEETSSIKKPGKSSQRGRGRSDPVFQASGRLLEQVLLWSEHRKRKVEASWHSPPQTAQWQGYHNTMCSEKISIVALRERAGQGQGPTNTHWVMWVYSVRACVAGHGGDEDKWDAKAAEIAAGRSVGKVEEMWLSLLG